MRLACDFDGTISKLDTTDLILSRLAAPEWEVYEDAWLAGTLSAAECMRAQIALIDPDDDKLNALLDGAELTDGFAEMAAWCADEDIPLSIISDGVDYFIRRILARHGLSHLPVIANRLTARDGRRALDQPWQRAGCAAQSGVCKCMAASLPDDDLLVFVGDGRSDFCVAGRADVVFARDKLAAYCRSREMAHHEFNDFHDVRRILAGLQGHRDRRAVV